jgi:pimeloyl-ACP methyl ester carboxylesterase
MEHHITIGPYWNIGKLQRVPRHRLSYLEFGDSSNEQVVFCVHGLSRNAHDFDYLANALSKDFRVIAVSMPGRGSSEWFKDAKYYNYHTYIHDIRHILKTLKIPSVHFIGTSMGGLIGMALATYYSKHIRTLVINDVGPEVPKATLSRMEKYLNADPAFSTISDAKTHMKTILKYFGITEEEHWEHVTKYSTVMRGDGKYGMHYDKRVLQGKSEERKSPSRHHDSQFIDLWHLWYKVRCPVLLIHGANSDILVGSTITKMRSIRDFDLYTIPDSGHAPALFVKRDTDAVHKWIIAQLST